MEQLGFEIVDETLEYEERRYKTSWWATTTFAVTGRVLDHVSAALTCLKQYINGSNENKTQIPEKVPMLLKIQCDVEEEEQKTFKLFQFLGDGQGFVPPNPTESGINIEKWESFEAFVRPFEELKEDYDFISEARNLRAFLSEFHVCSYYDDDCYYVANYDGHNSLWKHKNEIWFLKQAD